MLIYLTNPHWLLNNETRFFGMIGEKIFRIVAILWLILPTPEIKSPVQNINLGT